MFLSFCNIFLVDGYSYDHISVVNDYDNDNARQNSCWYFDVFRTGSEYYSVLQNIDLQKLSTI